jgi:SAM-dependent methyltransferase
MSEKRYDRAYFDRWYRNPRTRIHVRAGVARKVALAVHAAEYVIGRRIRTVLDVGCGEGAWQPLLARLRPGVRYLGVDASPYAAARYGRTRSIVRGRFGALDALGLAGPFDLVVCADVLHYVAGEELEPGLAAIARRMGGIAFIEVFTSVDSIIGDFRDMKRRRPADYDRVFRRAGLVHCGLCCFVREEVGAGLTSFERGREIGDPPRRSANRRKRRAT